MERIKTHKELIVYQLAFNTSMEIFRLSREFPREEIYSLTSQILNSSRSVSANLAEAFRKRRYNKAFIAKLSDSESESAETQTWLDYALACGYLDEKDCIRLSGEYDKIIGMIVKMIINPEPWSL